MTVDKISVYIITMLFSISLLIHMSRKENRYWGAYDNFRLILASTALLTLIEMLSWVFDGVVGAVPHAINIITNYMLFYLSALPITMWFMYFDSRLQLDKRELKIKKMYYIVVNSMIVFFTSLNMFVPILFRINESNCYVGKNGTMLIASIQLIFVLSYAVEIVSLRENVEERLLKMVIILSVLPILAAGAQTVYFGLVILWPIMTYVAFVAFLLIERDEMAKDPLTKLQLRRQMESKLRELLGKDRNFALIMIDLNDFKIINDTYGHLVGDEVLREFAKILKKSVIKKDQIFRYAGDEFVIITENNCDEIQCHIIDKIIKNIEIYNNQSGMIEKLSMSYGVAMISGKEHESIENVLMIVDNKMYENKKMYKGLLG